MIKRPVDRFLCVLLFLLVQLPARSCGPDWAKAVFVKKHGPDAPYLAFTQGRLGVPQPDYRTRHLVVVYRYLNRLALSRDEQQAAVRANNLFTGTWDSDQQSPSQEHAGFISWIDARVAFGPVDGYVPNNPLGSQDSWQFDSYFEVCLDDAFKTATQTLKARQTMYGKRSADVVEWIRGQDAVFENCVRPRSPSDLPPNAAQWLQYDRAYQKGAALLYRKDYDAAVQVFSAIAADQGSPWSSLSRYLVGRAMVTRAVDQESYSPGMNQETAAESVQRLDHYLDGLRSARTELVTMRAEPRMQPLLHAIDAMIDRTNARLEPEVQSRRLAARLAAEAPDPNFYQDVLDLSYLLSHESDVDDPAIGNRPKTPAPSPTNVADSRAADMLDWMRSLHSGDTKHCLQRWHATHGNAWLLAALTWAKSSDVDTPELIQAAKAVKSDDPAFVSITYNRLRLARPTAVSQDELLTVLPDLTGNESASTRNLVAALRAETAPDLSTWLQASARKPAAEAIFSEEDPFDAKPVPQPCGPRLKVADTPLFAADSATILNTRLPLRLLTEAAAGNALPANLRFQVAQSAWARAVLLDRPEIAARLSPILVSCNEKWRPVLSAYDHAKAADDRKAAALFAMMRFASTEPDVREGNYRVEGFAAYSYYRDNWWCFTIPPARSAQGGPQIQYGDDVWGFSSTEHTEVPDPAFLTSADREEAAREIAGLRCIPKASAYFSLEAIAWQRAHPHDPRAPELLGQAFRVLRNACGDKQSTGFEHSIFLVLHRNYPKSRWTKRYRSWE